MPGKMPRAAPTHHGVYRVAPVVFTKVPLGAGTQGLAAGGRRPAGWEVVGAGGPRAEQTLGGVGRRQQLDMGARQQHTATLRTRELRIEAIGAGHTVCVACVFRAVAGGAVLTPGLADQRLVAVCLKARRQAGRC